MPNCDVAIDLELHSPSEIYRASKWYINTSQEFFDVLKQHKPTTTSIEYYLTKMAWLKNCGRGSESWQTLGIAIRQAQEMDLHQVREDNIQNPNVSLAQTLTRLWELEHRKRLWARIFIMDSHMAIALGRPRGIHREDCTTQAPLDCDYPVDTSQTVPMSTKHAHEPPNSFSPVIFSIALSHKYHDLMSLRASRRDLRDDSKVRDLHEQVQLLLTALPPALRPSYPDTTWDGQRPEIPAVRQRLLATANIFLLALHRPYISTHEASRYAAIDAAFEILKSQQRLFGFVHEPQYKLYGYSFYTIDAGIFLAATVLKYPNLDRDISERALQELQQATIRLGLMKERSSIAKTGEVILRQCCAMLEARTPSAASTRSPDGFGIDELNIETTDFLQEFGSRIPDQDTRDFLSLLADPTTFCNIPTVSGSFGDDVRGDTSTVSSVPSLAPQEAYMDTMSSHQLRWQF